MAWPYGPKVPCSSTVLSLVAWLLIFCMHINIILSGQLLYSAITIFRFSWTEFYLALQLEFLADEWRASAGMGNQSTTPRHAVHLQATARCQKLFFVCLTSPRDFLLLARDFPAVGKGFSSFSQGILRNFGKGFSCYWQGIFLFFARDFAAIGKGFSDFFARDFGILARDFTVFSMRMRSCV